MQCLVGDHYLAGQDHTGAGEEAAVGEKAHEGEDGDEGGELEPGGGGVEGEEFPEEHEDDLGGGDGPDGSIEVAAVGAFFAGGGLDAGELAECAEEENEGGEGQVSVVVNLLHGPESGEGGDEQAGEVQQAVGDGGGPGKGVADAAVKGIGTVLVEAQDVGSGLSAGETAAEGGDASAGEDEGEPEGVAEAEAVGEEGEGEGAGGEEKDKDPDGPMTGAIDAGVAGAHLAFCGVLDFAFEGHGCAPRVNDGWDGLDALDGHGDGVATAEAEGGDATGFVGGFHGVEEGDEDARAAGSDGMAEGDGSAMDVDAGGVEVEFADDGEGLDAEGFVEFEEVDLVEGPSGFLGDGADGVDGGEGHPLGRAAGGGLGADDGSGLEAEGLGAGFIRNQQGGCAVADSGSVAGGDGAIGFEGGLEAGKDFGGGLGADGFVYAEERWRRAFFGGGDFDGEDFFFEVGAGGGGAAVGFCGEGVLFGAGDGVLVGDELGTDAHVEVVVNLPETVVDHGVDELAVAHAVAGAGLG